MSKCRGQNCLNEAHENLSATAYDIYNVLSEGKGSGGPAGRLECA
jgi:hypothetical protein